MQISVEFQSKISEAVYRLHTHTQSNERETSNTKILRIYKNVDRKNKKQNEKKIRLKHEGRTKRHYNENERNKCVM